MAEGTSLLRMHTAYTCIVGSNPTVSARTWFAELQRTAITPGSHAEAGGFSYSGVLVRPPVPRFFRVVMRGHFPNDEAAAKLLFLALRNIETDWKMPQRTWTQAANQFAIMFGERFKNAIT